jgi:hypothetical protein
MVSQQLPAGVRLQTSVEAETYEYARTPSGWLGRWLSALSNASSRMIVAYEGSSVLVGGELWRLRFSRFQRKSITRPCRCPLSPALESWMTLTFSRPGLPRAMKVTLLVSR